MSQFTMYRIQKIYNVTDRTKMWQPLALGITMQPCQPTVSTIITLIMT